MKYRLPKLSPVLFILLALVGFNFPDILAQNASNYFYSTASDGSLENMTTGTTELYGGNRSSYIAQVNQIGFQFVFMGKIYSQFSANTSGQIRLGTLPIVLTNIDAGENGAIITAIKQTLQTAPNGKVHYKVTGSVPDRVLVVEWKDMRIVHNSTGTEYSTFQALLYESTGAIEFRYGKMWNLATSGTNIAIGFSSSNTVGSVGCISGINQTPTFVTNGTSYTNTLFSASSEMVNLHSTADGNRRVFRFEPGVAPNAPTDMTFGAVTPNSIVINWTGSGNATGYILYRSTNGSDYSLFDANITANQTSITAQNLNPNTTYYWRLLAINEGKLSSPLDGTCSTGSGSISGTKTIGSGGDYPTLTAAISAIQVNGLNGPTILEFRTTYTTGISETFPVTFTNLSTSATNTLTIRPASGHNGIEFSSSNTTATFRIVNEDYVIIDGRPAGAGTNRRISVRNTNAAGAPALLFIDDASSNTIRYCTFSGSNTNNASGVVLFGRTSGMTGNDNNLIENCDINAFGSAVGICSYGTGGKDNSGNTISNNLVRDFYISSSSTVPTYGILMSLGSTDFTVSGNSLYQTASSRTYSSTATLHYGIAVDNPFGGGFTISGNYIGGMAVLAGGNPYTFSSGSSARARFNAIYINAGITIPTSVQGNFVKNLTMSSSYSSSDYLFIGINAAGGAVNIGTVTGNAIGSSLGNSITVQLYGASTATSVGGIVTSGASPVQIGADTVAGITLNANNSAYSGNLYGISIGTTSGIATVSGVRVGTAAAPLINNSGSGTVSELHYTVGINVAAGSSTTGITISGCTVNYINMPAGSGNTGAMIYGIRLASTGTVYTITGNTITHLTTGSSKTTKTMAGIIHSGVTAPTVFSRNTIHSFTSTGTSTVEVSGISCSGTTTGQFSLEKNLIHSFGTSSTSTLTVLNGIVIESGVYLVANNMIRLGVDKDSASVSGNIILNGILKTTTSRGVIIYNTAFIGGTVTGSATANTFAMRRSSNSSEDSVFNNCFVNNRTYSSGTARNYCISTNSAAGREDNNLFHYTGTGGAVGSVNGGTTAQTTLAHYRSAFSGRNDNSLFGLPEFFNATGNAALVNLHVRKGSQVESAGSTLFPYITDDFDNDIRATMTPVDIGADAGNFSTDSITFANIGAFGDTNPKKGAGTRINAIVNVAGVTSVTGAQVGISGWIGYSLENTDPATWTNWVPATFSIQSGNNDIYQARVGDNLPEGTYYVASRFKYNKSVYYYGGFSSNGGGRWDGVTNTSLSFTVMPHEISWVSLKTPGSGTIQRTRSMGVTGRVFVDEVTTQWDSSAGLLAWVGVNSANSDPATWPESNWTRAVCTLYANGTHDEYLTPIGGDLQPGTYYYATRFMLVNGNYSYGGYSSDGGGIWDGTTNVNGVLLVEPFVTNIPHSQNFDLQTLPQMPSGWVVEDANSDGILWQTSNEWYNSGYNAIRILPNASVAMDDWVFTPGFNLIGGEEYQIVFFYRSRTTTPDQRLEVKFGTSQSSTGMTSPAVFSNTAIGSIVWTKAVATILPEASGIYYIGFHGYSSAGSNYLFLDDVSFRAKPSQTATVTIPANSLSEFSFASTGVRLAFQTANWSQVKLTIDRIEESPGVVGTANFDHYAPIYWAASLDSGSIGRNFNLKLDVSGIGGISNPATLHLISRANSNSPWIDRGTPTITESTVLSWGSVVLPGEFSLAGFSDNPLPVQLSAFNATADARDIILNWETQTEENANRFVVERKAENCSTWSNIGEVRANGNSNSPKKYNFTDKKLNSGKYSYRLKMIDNDGTFEYSDVIESDIGLPKEYAISQNYPNPFNPTTKIDFQLPFDSRVQIELYNITGERVATLINAEMQAGFHTYEMAQTAQLSSGVYIYRIIASSSSQTSPFTAVKKMVLMK